MHARTLVRPLRSRTGARHAGAVILSNSCAKSTMPPVTCPGRVRLIETHLTTNPVFAHMCGAHAVTESAVGTRFTGKEWPNACENLGQFTHFRPYNRLQHHMQLNIRGAGAFDYVSAHAKCVREQSSVLCDRGPVRAMPAQSFCRIPARNRDRKRVV